LVSVSHACFSDGNKLQAGCTKKPWPQGALLDWCPLVHGFNFHYKTNFATLSPKP
jgi:hypothetical protein